LLPVGDGLLSWRLPEEALEGIRRVEADWEAHARAAREMALAHFEASTVLRALLERL